MAKERMQAGNPFPGFDPPTENWSKLPHALIESLPAIETVSELKVILYILRHTWGFQEDQRRISVDEFANGRRKKNSGRVDGGTGLSVNAVRDGLKRAMSHGFIEVEIDNHDLGRVQKLYRLRMKEAK